MPVLRPLEPVRAVLRFLWSPIRKLRQRIRKSRGPIRNMAALPPTVQKIINDNVYGLPRLPINPLGDTLERYLTSVKPLCTPDEYAAQEKLCAEFQNGVGAQLHADLVSEDAHEGYPFSFIEKHWDVMYNGLRCPAPVNISPFFAINDEKDAKDMVQCARAAKFVHGFTRWTRKVLAGELEQDKDMCSHAYPKHFSSAKIPVKGMDELAMYPDSRHITVISNGNVFTLEIVSLEGTILEVTGIQAKLEDIVKRAHAEGAGSLPILTAEDRDVWADARASLEAVDGNKDKLQAIDAGIIAVCLDESPVKAGDLHERAQNLLVGPGSNRWWDKQQLVVDGSGFMGIVFEHSYGDGTNWGRFINDVMADVEGKLAVMATHEASAASDAVHVTLTVPASVQSTIDAAKANYRKLQDDISIEVLDFSSFGKDEIKTWNCSPDAVLQLAFQAAYFSLHNKMPPVYEACATRKFFHGRTETIRACTEASTAFCKALVSKAPKEEAVALMQSAAKTHSAISKAAAGGMGIDRHLTAMANNAAAKGMATPALFADAKFQYAKNWLLSTSNGSGPFLAMFGFAAVIPEGYGLGYLIENKKVNIVCTCFNSCKDTDAKKMAASIANTLNAMCALK